MKKIITIACILTCLTINTTNAQKNKTPKLPPIPPKPQSGLTKEIENMNKIIEKAKKTNEELMSAPGNPRQPENPWPPIINYYDIMTSPKKCKNLKSLNETKYALQKEYEEQNDFFKNIKKYEKRLNEYLEDMTEYIEWYEKKHNPNKPKPKKPKNENEKIVPDPYTIEEFKEKFPEIPPIPYKEIPKIELNSIKTPPENATKNEIEEYRKKLQTEYLNIWKYKNILLKYNKTTTEIEENIQEYWHNMQRYYTKRKKNK